MARQRLQPSDALLEQSRTVHAWLAALSPDDFSRPTVLPGWDVRVLTAHLILVHTGLAEFLNRPTRQRPLAVGHYVRRYRSSAAATEESTRSAADDLSGPELVASLGASVEDAARLLGGGPLPAVIDGPRGPISSADFLATRVVEVVVHSDDLSRSLPEGPAVDLHRAAMSRASRTLADILAGQHPGRSVEVRVPPYAAVQCAVAVGGVTDLGPTHTRGTPPNVVETDPLTFLRLATGRISWDAASADGLISASGLRANLAPALPLLS